MKVKKSNTYGQHNSYTTSIYRKNNYVGTLNYDPFETIDFSFELVSV